jgi:hypothetical protein
MHEINASDPPHRKCFVCTVHSSLDYWLADSVFLTLLARTLSVCLSVCLSDSRLDARLRGKGSGKSTGWVFPSASLCRGEVPLHTWGGNKVPEVYFAGIESRDDKFGDFLAVVLTVS